MVIQYEKGSQIQLSEHFSLKDFDCPCTRTSCVSTFVDTNILSVAEDLIVHFHILHINSGCRCSAHNADVDGKPGSFHLAGKAVDVWTELANTEEIYEYAETLPLIKNGGMGLAKTFVHVDVRGFRSRWKYF